MSVIACKVVSHLRAIPLIFLKPSSSISQLSTKRNYWRRRNDFSEFSSAMRIMANCMRDMDREMDREIHRSPMKLSRFFRPWYWWHSKDIPIVTDSEHGRNYKLEFDMQDIQPEDITITLKDNLLTVKAREEEKSSDGSCAIRQYSYSHDLPKDVSLDTIQSRLNNGILTIEAVLPALDSHEIPINVETGDKSSSSNNGKQ